MGVVGDSIGLACTVSVKTQTFYPLLSASQHWWDLRGLIIIFPLHYHHLHPSLDLELVLHFTRCFHTLSKLKEILPLPRL
jgi:hypothetical protein